MSDLIAVAFTDLAGADDVLRKLRRLRHGDVVEIEHACVVERNEQGEVHLKQAIGDRLNEAMHPRFWHRLIAHVLDYGQEHMPAEGSTPDLGLDCSFARQVATNLAPGSSALFVLVRKAALGAVTEALAGHHGTIIRTTLAEGERRALAEALAPQPPRLPTADHLLALARQEEEEEKAKAARAREAAEAERKRRLDRLRNEHLTSSDIAAAANYFVEAARRGETKVLAYRFPSELCTDGGRAINNNLPEWPETLVGQPREIYDFWRQRLRPAGYHLTVKILNFPEGMPGDVGFIFSWG